MKQNQRLAAGGSLIDRTNTIDFSFDGVDYQGYRGDTLASALLANGLKLIGRSFKYHRPRGILSTGVEEPNALVHIGRDARLEPNTRATLQEIYPGLLARHQHCWPSLKYDVGALNNVLSPFFPAGFYYKTFMWPASFWQYYEAVIRRAAGLGKASRDRDPDRYDCRNAHCDVLIVGAGPAGLSAAQTAAQRGERVILVEQHHYLGGWLRQNNDQVQNKEGLAWIGQCLNQLTDARILTRTTAFGYYDDNLIAAVERVQDHRADFNPHLPRQRLWRIRTKRVILATGSIEQGLVFANNDKPGVMLAGAVRSYLHNYAVKAGQRVVLICNNDDAYRTAIALRQARVSVPAIVDLRHQPSGYFQQQATALGMHIFAGHSLSTVGGRQAVKYAELTPLNSYQPRQVKCDVIAMSGGWAPTVHLHSQTGAKLKFRNDLHAFVPAQPRQHCVTIGAAAGVFNLEDCIEQGEAAGAGQEITEQSSSYSAPKPLVKVPRQTGKAFVDFQNDVTVADVELAHREGYHSVEHLKRYTTLGMGTDQGKTSNLTALSLLAEQRKQPIPVVGTTTFRPPYTPVTLGALAGRSIGAHFKPLRRSPMDDWHRDHGAVWIDAGLWRRPHFYPQTGEDVDSAAERETRATRASVGLCDVTTLGKIDIQGPDSATFLNRIYANGFAKLPIGRARYGVMLREDGLVFDDGTTSRLSEQHFFMTTTTANAAKVLMHLEYYLQLIWPELAVQVTSVTEQWAGIAIAGPNARKVLRDLVDIDISNEQFPFMAAAECKFMGISARLFRISFSGELAYELNIPADYGISAWQALLEAGNSYDIVTYGMEALGTMRVEKGHVAGSELNGQTTLDDLGLGRMAGQKGFVGKVLRQRPALQSNDRLQLVGLVPQDGTAWIKVGSQLLAKPNMQPPVDSLGHVTSIAYSPELGMPIALALLSGGLQQHENTEIYAAFPLKNELIAVKVVAPHFVDPEGSRLHA